MTASCNKDFEGLIGGHAYTILGVNNSTNTSLVKLRNPIGQEEYTGPWNNFDK